MITQLIIDSNCYISRLYIGIPTITETWLTIDDSALASQLTPDGFNVLLADRYILHHRGSLALLLLSELSLFRYLPHVSLHMKF